MSYSPEAVAAWMSCHGRTAFEAYAKSVGHTAYDGSHIPAWEALTDPVKLGWEAAALAAIAAHVKATDQ